MMMMFKKRHQKVNNFNFYFQNKNNNKKNFLLKESKIMDCPVCLEKCVHPAKLPCGHIFCFLCVKVRDFLLVLDNFFNFICVLFFVVQGLKNRRCALCRGDIPIEFLDHPQLVHGFETQNIAPTEDGHQWFYEGRNGESFIIATYFYIHFCVCLMSETYIEKENILFQVSIKFPALQRRGFTGCPR